MMVFGIWLSVGESEANKGSGANDCSGILLLVTLKGTSSSITDTLLKMLSLDFNMCGSTCKALNTVLKLELHSDNAKEKAFSWNVASLEICIFLVLRSRTLYPFVLQGYPTNM